MWDTYSNNDCPVSFCVLRSGSGHHLCQRGLLRAVAASCGNALWTCRTANDRRPADASWPLNGQLPSGRPQPQRGRTVSRSTSQRPKHDFEVQGFIPPPLPSLPVPTQLTLAPANGVTQPPSSLLPSVPTSLTPLIFFHLLPFSGFAPLKKTLEELFATDSAPWEWAAITLSKHSQWFCTN